MGLAARYAAVSCTIKLTIGNMPISANRDYVGDSIR